MREVKRYICKTKDGNVVGHVRRLESESDAPKAKPSKKYIPYFREGGQMAGLPEEMPGSHRIYGMDAVTDTAKPVFIVEGEKCAHALQTLGYQAITSLGGSGSGHRADWSLLSDARHIYILPDHDDVGWTYARGVYGQVRFFRQLEAVQIVRFPLHEKADVCDYLKTLLPDWNELKSLDDHPSRHQVRETFDRYVKDNAIPIPADWTFRYTPQKHKLIAVNDFRNLALPERKVMLAPWLQEGSISMIFADRGIGKTFFALSCALALANGERFLCFHAPEPVSVLYLDGEMQATAIQSRLQKLSGGRATRAPFHLYTPDCQDNDYIPDIGTAQGRGEVDEMIESTDVRVIFLDNISAFDRTGNENEAESWSPIQSWAIQHRKKGRAVVFIHHTNKDGKQRGTHKKEDVMDAVICLKRPDGYIQGDGPTKMLVQYTKARHLSGEQAQGIEATLTDNKSGLIHWDYVQGHETFLRAVDLLHDGMSIRDIATELGTNKSKVQRWKDKACADGLL